MAPLPELPAINGLIDTLRAEKIRFIIIGMGAALLQGVPVATFDFDIWIDLPPRQYMRVLNLALRLGGQVIANTVVVLPGDLTVNFIYGDLIGLGPFRSELRKAISKRWMGRVVPVLPLPRIYQSKKAVGRPKDIAHLPHLEATMRLQRRIKRRGK